MKDTRTVCDHCHNECCIDDKGYHYLYVTFLDKADNKLDVTERTYCYKCYKMLIREFKEAHPEVELEL